MRLTRYDAEHLPASAAPLYQDMAADWLDLEDECQRLREERNGFFIGMMEEKARAEQAEAERERYREALERKAKEAGRYMKAIGDPVSQEYNFHYGQHCAFNEARADLDAGEE